MANEDLKSGAVDILKQGGFYAIVLVLLAFMWWQDYEHHEESMAELATQTEDLKTRLDFIQSIVDKKCP